MQDFSGHVGMIVIATATCKGTTINLGLRQASLHANTFVNRQGDDSPQGFILSTVHQTRSATTLFSVYFNNLI